MHGTPPSNSLGKMPSPFRSIHLFTLGQSIVMVPEEFAETSSKILVYLAQVLDIPEASEDMDGESTEEVMFTAEELEALEPIAEEVESSIPSVINGIRVNRNPRSAEIQDIIDLRRIGSSRRTFYLAKKIDGTYYWFHSPRTDRDPQLRRLAGDYRCKSQVEAGRKKTRGVKKLRSGRKIRM